MSQKHVHVVEDAFAAAELTAQPELVYLVLGTVVALDTTLFARVVGVVGSLGLGMNNNSTWSSSGGSGSIRLKHLI